MKYLLLVLFMTGCSFNHEETKPSKTEFFFKQKVKVTEGFYKGLEGVVVGEGRGYSDCFRTYEVYLKDDREGRVPGEVELCNYKLEAM